MVVMAGSRLRGRRFDSPIGTFFFHSFYFIFFTPFIFFCLILFPFFFLHARSAISILEHFSSLIYYRYILDRICEDFGVICSLDPKPVPGACC